MGKGGRVGVAPSPASHFTPFFDTFLPLDPYFEGLGVKNTGVILLSSPTWAYLALAGDYYPPVPVPHNKVNTYIPGIHYNSKVGSSIGSPPLREIYFHFMVFSRLDTFRRPFRVLFPR